VDRTTNCKNFCVLNSRHQHAAWLFQTVLYDQLFLSNILAFCYVFLLHLMTAVSCVRAHHSFGHGRWKYVANCCHFNDLWPGTSW